MQIERLLKRIKAESVDRRASLDSLQQLCMCFVSNIPFETTDMFGGSRKVLDLNRIYEIIVEENRGGFCCDLNGLFQWLLKRLGFQVEMLKAYYYEKDNDSFSEISDHMTLLVTLDNGEKYLTDVGWGGSCFTLPLQMKIGLVQSQPNGVYRLGKEHGYITVEKKGQRYLKIAEDIIRFENEEQRSTVVGNDGGAEEWNKQFRFTEVGCELSDFREGHDFAQFTNEFLVNNMLAVLQNERGRKFLFNNLYFEKEYVNPETIKLKTFKRCTVAQMYEILEKEFGLKVTFELKLKKFIE